MRCNSPQTSAPSKLFSAMYVYNLNLFPRIYLLPRCTTQGTMSCQVLKKFTICSKYTWRLALFGSEQQKCNFLDRVICIFLRTLHIENSHTSRACIVGRVFFALRLQKMLKRLFFLMLSGLSARNGKNLFFFFIFLYHLCRILNTYSAWMHA